MAYFTDESQLEASSKIANSVSGSNIPGGKIVR